jgi:predicted RND superfamily exporter protein
MSRDSSLSILLDEIDKDIEATLEPELKPAIWGILLWMVTVSDLIARDQIVSTVLSLILVFILTAAVFRSVRYGFYSLVPLITGILLNFLFMIIFKIPMDMTTVMFSIVVIGVGVDNSIHFILRFREQARKYDNDIKKILAEAMKIAGRPIIVTTASIIGGLFVLTFASFRPISYFGILVAFALITAAGSTLIILPAILTFGWKVQKRMHI